MNWRTILLAVLIGLVFMGISLPVNATNSTFISVPGAGLKPSHPDQQVIRGNGWGEAWGGTGDTFSYMSIQLPHHAKILNLFCILQDNDPVGYIQVNLLRTPITTSEPDQWIAGFGTGRGDESPEYLELTDDPVPERDLVDNSNFMYFFRVDFLDLSETTPFNPNVKLRGCRVEVLLNIIFSNGFEQP